MNRGTDGTDPPEKHEGPTVGQTAGPREASAGEPSAEDSLSDGNGKKALIGDLADIPAVRDYLNRVGAQVRSMRAAVVTQAHGRYWRDLATIKLDKETGEIAVRSWSEVDAGQYEPTKNEEAAIKAACAEVTWPEPVALPAGPDGFPALPDKLKNVPRENLFAFHDMEGRVVMLQRRASSEELVAGKPKYTPWSHWSDGEWRNMEPDGPLPLWGLDSLKDHSTVFLHEGAQAARAMRSMLADDREARDKLAAHPWGDELDGAAHLGWIGGALSPHRTDWSLLARAGVSRVYVVADHDEAGREAVPRIAKHLRMPTFAVVFTDEFPASFDLADDFPSTMFDKDGRYTGPEFAALVESATWATDTFERPGGGKPITQLREHFKNMWVYADEPELFACKVDTRIVRSAQNLNNKLVKFSDTPGTARLLLAECEQVSTLAYVPQKPDRAGRVAGTVTVRGQRAFNVYRPGSVKPQDGSAAPWLEFMAYLFPKDAERREVMRWCATLIAQPHVRMHFGLLLASRTQGVGKGIFASQVLAPLVGDHNVGYPSEHDIAESAFNDWMAHKRLVVVGEIYQGSSWKAYNRLKGVITDKDFSVNKKHQAQYRIDNWCHVIACSNSETALKMERTDRRWFYPAVTETPWPRDKFANFVAWLRGDGLGIVARWAMEFGDYVRTGELPAMTNRKQVMIEESEPEELRWVREYCEEAIAEGGCLVISTEIAMAYVRRSFGKTIYTKKRELGLGMEEAGMVQLVGPDGAEFFVKWMNARHRVFLSPAAEGELKAMDEGARRDWLKKKLGEVRGALLETM